MMMVMMVMMVIMVLMVMMVMIVMVKIAMMTKMMLALVDKSRSDDWPGIHHYVSILLMTILMK